MVRSSFVLTVSLVAAVFAAAPAHAEDATVPDVVGLSLQEAEALLTQAGFEPSVNRVPGEAIDKVISQEPGGLCTRSKGGPVTLTVVGPTPKPMPGPPPPGPGPTKPPDGPPAGNPGDPLGPPPGVDPGPDPMPGPPPSDPGPAPVDPPPSGDAGLDALPQGRLPVQDGPEVPGVLGQQTRQAQASLRRWKVSVEYTLGVPALIGKVVNQRPHAGARLASGEQVVLVVAVGESPSAQHRSVPQLEGSAWTQAVRAVRTWGFTADARTVPSSAAERGKVVRQTPLPGSLAVEGTTVLILVGRGSGAAAMPSDPAPSDPGMPPTDPGPTDPGPAPADPSSPPPPAPAANLATPGLSSPPAGESYPYRYGATFEWTAVSGATAYEWELQEESQAGGAWQSVAKQTVTDARYRPASLERGRYRWRVRAVKNGAKGAWSTFRRLYMY